MSWVSRYSNSKSLNSVSSAAIDKYHFPFSKKTDRKEIWWRLYWGETQENFSVWKMMKGFYILSWNSSQPNSSGWKMTDFVKYYFAREEIYQWTLSVIINPHSVICLYSDWNTILAGVILFVESLECGGSSPMIMYIGW